MSDKSHVTITCNQCGRRVKNTFQSKWDHIVRRHPEIMVQRFLPILGDPEKAYQFGAAMAEKIRREIL